MWFQFKNKMKKATFKRWDLTSLDKAFGLTQIWKCELLSNWQKMESEITDSDRETLLMLQASLIRGGRAWNEVELENKFISPLIMTARIDDEQMGYFLERPLAGIVGDYELSGIVDGIIAMGFRDPDVPFFCMHEYSPLNPPKNGGIEGGENQGTPDGQVLAAMLIAREQNNNEKPIYGMYVVGLYWTFIVLEGNKYCVSRSYNGAIEDIFTIFGMLKALKQIIVRDLM